MSKNDYDNNYFDAVFKSIFEDIKSLTSRVDRTDETHATKEWVKEQISPLTKGVFIVVGLMTSILASIVSALILRYLIK